MNTLSKSKHFHRHYHYHASNPTSAALPPASTLPSAPSCSSPSSPAGTLSASLASGGGGKHHATQRKHTGAGSKRSSATAGGSNANAMKKGTSLNHLLNFTLPPRQVQQPLPAGANARKSSSRAAPRGAGGAAWTAVHSKERFINANFRFVVKLEGSYVKQLADPDVPIDWDLVDQVIMPTTDLPACPICLTSPPTAPRITKCGHVFCLPCILHYHTVEPYDVWRARSRGDPSVPMITQRWRKCPICHDAIYEPELRAVRLWTSPTLPKMAAEAAPGWVAEGVKAVEERPELVQHPHSTHHHRGKKGAKATHADPPPAPRAVDVDHERELMTADAEYARVAASAALALVDLTLVGRHPGSVLVFPIACPTSPTFASFSSVHKPAPGTMHPPSVAETGALSFARLLTSTPEYLATEVWAKDRDEIEAERTSTATAVGAIASEVASESVAQSLVFLGMAAEGLDRLISECQEKMLGAEEAATMPTVAKSSGSTRGGRGRRGNKQDSAASAAATGDDSSSTASSSDVLYFYVAANGSHTYLHPADAKVLASVFRGYANCPARLSVPVLHVQETTITTDLRLQFPSLAHIPEGCDVTLLEVDVARIVRDTAATVESDKEAEFMLGVLDGYGGELFERKRARLLKARKEAVVHWRALADQARDPRRRPGGVIDPDLWDPHGHHRGSLDGGHRDDEVAGGGSATDMDLDLARALAESAALAGSTPPKASTSAPGQASFAQAARSASHKDWRPAAGSARPWGAEQAAFSSSAYALDLGLLGAELDALDSRPDSGPHRRGGCGGGGRRVSMSSGSSEHEEEHDEGWDYGYGDEDDEYGDMSVAGDRFGQAVVIAARAGRCGGGSNGAGGQKGAGNKQPGGGGGSGGGANNGGGGGKKGGRKSKGKTIALNAGHRTYY